MSATEVIHKPGWDRPLPSGSPVKSITISPTKQNPVRSETVERWIQVLIMLAIGGAAGAGSFRHVHDVAATHGQDGWLAWADAVVLELMSVASGLELRRRKRAHEPTRFPAVVMAVAVVLSLAAQVVEAERSVIGWVAAAIPALGFLVMVKIALARSGTAADALEVDAASTVPLSTPVGSGSLPSPAENEDADPWVEVLIPAARAAAQALHSQRRRVTSRALADVLRADGYGVSNARASELLKELKPEFDGRESSTRFERGGVGTEQVMLSKGPGGD